MRSKCARDRRSCAIATWSGSGSTARTDASPLTIYHNPGCSKSRATLALLRDRGLEPQVVEYLTSPPSAAELKLLIERLGIRPEQLVRKGEDIYRNPILIERPIVVRGQRAAIGRPPENILPLLA